jgi:hypothetical protein
MRTGKTAFIAGTINCKMFRVKGPLKQKNLHLR